MEGHVRLRPRTQDMLRLGYFCPDATKQNIDLTLIRLSASVSNLLKIPKLLAATVRKWKPQLRKSSGIVAAAADAYRQ